MKSRLISMLLTGIVLALGLLLAVQVTHGLRGGRQANAGDVGAEAQDFNQTVSPVIFKFISEQDGQLRLEGSSEPDAVITIQSMGQNLRQIRADDKGEWVAVIVVNDNPTLSIELVAFMENGAKVRSDETLYRIPAPLVKSGEDNIQRRALIMKTAPGGPSHIVQSPFGELPQAGPLVMGPIDYDENGSVIFSGTSKIEGQVQVFAGDMPVGERTVGANGRWFFIAAEILPLGIYDVTAELITEDAEPHKVTVPFRRITQSALGSASQDDLAVSFRSNVWQISRTLNAGGRQYTAIFAPQKTAIPDETQKTSP